MAKKARKPGARNKMRTDTNLKVKDASPPLPPKLPEYWIYGGAATLLFITLNCIFFAPLGLNPTDSGLSLAVARRLIDGQVPYRDFIWMRPLGAVLHIPVVAFGGDYVIILSRYLSIIQNSVLIWLLTEILRKEVWPKIPRNQFLALLLIAQCLGSSLPLWDAYYTRDAVFMCVAGTFLSYQQGNRTKHCIGHFLIGAAFLAKQNFAVLIPVYVLLFKSWRDMRLMVSILLPGLLFGTYLLVNGIFQEAYLQITSLSGHLGPSALRTLTSPYTAAGFAAAFISAYTGNRWLLGALAISLPCISAAAIIFAFHTLLHCLLPFGYVLGLIAYSYARREYGKFTPHLWFLLLLGWTISLSYGFHAPQLVFALYTILPYMLIFCTEKNGGSGSQNRRKENLQVACLTAVLLLVVIPTYTNQQLNHTYRTKNYSFLTVPMAGKFPGANGIVASPTMAYVYEQMNDMIELANSKNKQYAILPEMTLYWATSPQPNPLPSDWPLAIELGNNKIFYDRLSDAADKLRPNTLFIVQKFSLERIIKDAPGLKNIEPVYQYPIYHHIKSNYRLVAESDLFRVYE